jgi:hypothetical protein
LIIIMHHGRRAPLLVNRCLLALTRALSSSSAEANAGATHFITTTTTTTRQTTGMHRAKYLAVSARSFASNHVVDSIVTIHCIDASGHRHTLRGLEGQSLADVFAEHTDVLGADAVAPSPEGRGKVEAHVKVPGEWAGVVGSVDGEDAEVLEALAGDAVDGHSRLGSRVVLGRGMEGMTVSIGGLYPWKSL